MKWEANGGRDLHLSSFKLTNRQMLWLAMAHVDTIKYQEGSALQAFKLTSTYLHLLFKQRENFRQAFGCQELNALEKMEIDSIRNMIVL